MIRIVVENILIFLIPTLLYAAYVLVSSPSKDEAQLAQRTVARVLEEAPLLWLFTAGAILVLLSLIAFRGFDGGRPGQEYQPPVYRDGRIEPGHVK